MATRTEIAVIGCGGIGASACLALTRRGVGVLGLERHRLGHACGSSHGGTRVFREAYFEHPDYVPLLRRAREIFRELEAESGEAILEACGVLLAGGGGSEVIAASRHAAAIHGVEVESLAAGAIAERFPAFAGGGHAIGLHEPGGGFVRPEATVAASLAVARRRGAEIREGAEVRRIAEHGGGVEIDLGDETVLASRAVVAGGAWSASLLPMRLPLAVTRQVQAWLAVGDREAAMPPRLPAWLVDRGAAPPLYGVPIDPRAGRESPGRGLAKIAVHGGGDAADPDRVDRVVAAAEREELDRLAAAHLPGLPGRVAAASVCLYTSTPDGHFVVDRSEGGRIAFACGFSGHGFKFAPAIGEALADLAMHGASPLPIGFLRASRLRGR